MITCMNIIEPLNEPQCFYLLGPHMAAPSHKMQMFFLFFCRRQRRTFEIAQYGPHTSQFCTGKMADACPVCLYKEETSSRGITFICAPFFCYGMYVSMGWITAEKKPGKTGKQ